MTRVASTAVRRAARTWTASWTTVDVPRRLSPTGTMTAPYRREVWSRTDDEAETKTKNWLKVGTSLLQSASKSRLGPKIIVCGLETEKSRKIVNGAYNSELITPESKRISERLKRSGAIRQWPTRCTFDLDF